MPHLVPAATSTRWSPPAPGTTLRWFRSVFGDGADLRAADRRGGRGRRRQRRPAVLPVRRRRHCAGPGRHRPRRLLRHRADTTAAPTSPAPPWKASPTSTRPCSMSSRTRGHQVGPITISDGEARSHLWNQIKADVMGEPITPSLRVEAPSIGAAILAGLGTGLFDQPSTSTGSRARTRTARHTRTRPTRRRTPNSATTGSRSAAGVPRLRPDDGATPTNPRGPP